LPERSRAEARREAVRDCVVLGLSIHGLLLTVAVVDLPVVAHAVLSVVLGLLLAIGAVTVLHDAGHRRFSRRYVPNMLATQLAVPIGLWVFQWTIKHETHHRLPASYPDDEFTTANGLLRIHPAAPARWFHRYQHLYAWPLYALVWVGDLMSQLAFLATGRAPGSARRTSVNTRVRSFVIEKLVAAAVLTPYLALGGTRVVLVLGVAALIGGFCITTVLIVGHVNVGLTYGAPGDGRYAWRRYVVATTASFSTHNGPAAWMTGGLTHHLVHHLRPGLSRRELRDSYGALKVELEQKLGVAVVEFPSIASAVSGHYRALRNLGWATVGERNKRGVQ
jgi:linoleoyl-CoA desaturase